jgi:hypothetical protein
MLTALYLYFAVGGTFACLLMIAAAVCPSILLDILAGHEIDCQNTNELILLVTVNVIALIVFWPAIVFENLRIK